MAWVADVLSCEAPTSVPEAASASDLIVDEFGCTALHRAADEGNVTEVGVPLVLW